MFKIGGSLGKATESVKKAVKTGKIGGTLGKTTESIKNVAKTGKVGGTLGKYIESTKKGVSGIGKALSTKIDPTTLEKTDVKPLKSKLATSNKSLGESLAAQKETPRTKVALAETNLIDRAGVGDVSAEAVEGMEAVLAKRGDVADVTTSLDTAQQAQQRGEQTALAEALKAQAAGTTPSIAEMQARKAGERAIAQQAAMQAGQRGAQAALGRREVGRGTMALQADIARESGILRLQEQQEAQKQLGALTTQIRAQDLDVAQSQAENKLRADLANQGVDLDIVKQNAAAGNQAALANLQTLTDNADRSLKVSLANQGVDLDVLKANAAAGNATSIANMQASLTQLGLDDAMQQAYMQNELNISKMEMDNLLDIAKLESSEEIAQASIDASRKAAEAQAKGSIIGGGLGALGSIGAAFVSDINLKKDIKSGDKSIGEFLAALKPYDYKYKDEKHGKGAQNSVMAQDLEKSEIGKKAVIDTPEGKMVDYSKLLPAMLSANVDSNRRIIALEEALKARKKGNK